MLEAEMTREFVRTVTPAKIKALKEHVALEKSAVSGRRRFRAHRAARRLPRAQAPAHGQPGAGADPGRAHLALRPHHADVPERQRGRAPKRRARRHREGAGGTRRGARRAPHDRTLEHVEANLTFDRKVPQRHPLALS
ncbi:hypothetical protein DdX_20201 [Ditylenchus destructor]|uniref:Uncharacterized protein n=1 Tax=Ditylenchus destructor TaxID=166010 RepID=A0AAD4QWK3_9BILA|nr:hypothetical protein DdX_20201 [Ditylenchus destructor]